MSSQEPFNLDDVPPVMEQGEALKVDGGKVATFSEPMEPAPVVKPRVWPTYLSFVIVFVVSLGLGLVLGMGYAVWKLTVERTGDPTEGFLEWVQDPWILSVMGILQFFVLMGAALIAGKISSVGLKNRLDLNRPRYSWPAIALVSLGALGYSICFSAVADWLQWRSDAITTLGEAIKESQGAGWLMLVVVGVLAPVGEELYFRGYVQSRLGRRHGALIGIVIASAFFAILHMDVQHSLYAFGFGLYVGWLAWRAGSVYPAIVAHAVNNTYSVLATWYLQGVGDVWAWVVIAAAALFFVAGLVVIARWPRRELAVIVE